MHLLKWSFNLLYPAFIEYLQTVSPQVKHVNKHLCLFWQKLQIFPVFFSRKSKAVLSNGIKYAFKSTNLLIKIYNENRYTCFMFENHSPYITPENRKKIFARYITFAQAHKEFGIGLGLYASKRIVEAHNGKIFVKSFKDERNIFGFKIPNDASYKDKERFVTF